MARIIKCAKLGVDSEGFEDPPFPGPKGQEIYEKISKKAWQQWIAKQTMLINEYRLASFDPEAKAFLARERDKFLFEGNDELPDGYVPPAL